MSMFEVVAEGLAYIPQEDTEANVKVAMGKYYSPVASGNVAPFADMLGRKLAMSNRFKTRQIPGLSLWFVMDTATNEPRTYPHPNREQTIIRAERLSQAERDRQSAGMRL